MQLGGGGLATYTRANNCCRAGDYQLNRGHGLAQRGKTHSVGRREQLAALQLPVFTETP